jgi:hypothetical protein
MTNRWVAILHHVAVVVVLYSLLCLSLAVYRQGLDFGYLPAWLALMRYYEDAAWVVAAIAAFRAFSIHSPHTGTRLDDAGHDEHGQFGPSHSQEGLPMNGGVDTNGIPYGMDQTTMGD